MQELINCPSCQRKLQVPDSLLGQEVQCPTCQTTFLATGGGQTMPTVPDAPTSSYPAAPPPPSRYGDNYSGVRSMERRDQTPHRGTVILVLGILSIVLTMTFVFLGLILGPIAWTMANTDLREIRGGRMDSEGEGTTNAGRVCGIIGFILSLLYTLGCCLYIAFIVFFVGAAIAHGPKGR